jgi:alpha-beta hydrolase superfamily lysophospholipase
VAGEAHALPVAGGSLALVLHLPATVPAPAVITCHGLGASKDSEKYQRLGQALSAAGLAVARFDFRGAGESSPVPGGATVTSHLEDVDTVVDYLARDERLDHGRLGLLGSSLGGFVALHAAARWHRPTPVVTWNAPATLRPLLHRAPPDTELGPGFWAELRVGTLAEVPVGVRWLRVIHGDRDDVVPPEHAGRILAVAGEPKDYRIIAGGDHRLSVDAHRRAAVELSREWLVEHLVRAPASAGVD